MKNKVFLVLRIIGSALAVFNVVMFFAMRPCWSGISATLGYKGGADMFLYYLPIGICVFLFVEALADLILKHIFAKKNWIHVMFLAISTVFLAAIIVIIVMGAVDYMRFVWPTFFIGLGVVAAIGAAYFLLFIYPKLRIKENKVFKYGMLGLCVVCATLAMTNFSFHWITYDPVVYAVENDYQIVFSTSDEATAWVEIDGKNYYDTYNGTTKTFTKIHKIQVPMAALDAAKKYTVHAQQTIYAGPFGGFMGPETSKTVDFKPVDVSDGIQYLSFSDVHMNDWQTAKTASYVENYDFLVLIGDLVSVVETFDDANFNNKVAFDVTGGHIPVVYARGNHDVKGRYASELHKFVGAKGESFYYNFYFEDVYGLVLDLGEDHDDDWWEYYGTAHYEEYHQEQLDFLDQEIAKKNYDNYAYHVVACHIPVPFVNYRHNHEYVKAEMTARLNQMDIDMFLCGHQHQIMIFEPGLIEPNTELTYNPNYKTGTYKGYLTDFNFPTFMVSKPGFTFSDSTELSTTKSQIGFYVDVDLAGRKETCHYLNANGEKVHTMNMFYDKDYGTQIVIDLDTKQFLA